MFVISMFDCSVTLGSPSPKDFFHLVSGVSNFLFKAMHTSFFFLLPTVSSPSSFSGNSLVIETSKYFSQIPQSRCNVLVNYTGKPETRK